MIVILLYQLLHSGLKTNKNVNSKTFLMECIYNVYFLRPPHLIRESLLAIIALELLAILCFFEDVTAILELQHHEGYTFPVSFRYQAEIGRLIWDRELSGK